MPKVPFKQLPPKKRKFIQEYVRLGDYREAYISAGYKDNRATMANARRLGSKLSGYYRGEMTAYLKSVEMASLGARVLTELAESADSEGTRLNAAKLILERAVPEDKTINVKHSDLTEAELDRRLAEIQDQLFIDAPKAQLA